MWRLWPTGAERTRAEGEVPCALLHVNRLRGHPSPISGAEPRQALHSWGRRSKTHPEQRSRNGPLWRSDWGVSMLLSLQQVMKDKWINTGYEGDDLKPHIEPVEDYSDPARIGQPAWFIWVHHGHHAVLFLTCCFCSCVRLRGDGWDGLHFWRNQRLSPQSEIQWGHCHLPTAGSKRRRELAVHFLPLFTDHSAELTSKDFFIKCRNENVVKKRRKFFPFVSKLEQSSFFGPFSTCCCWFWPIALSLQEP